MCGIVQRRAEYLPLFTEAELKRRMHFLLMRTPWAGVAWHCWRRLSAAAMVALGAPITAVCIWNRWTSLRKAWEYAVLGPDWEFELPDQAPRAHLVASTTTLPLSSVQLWRASALGRRTAPNASGSPIIIMVNNNDEGNDSDDGVLGASGTNRGVSQENGNDVSYLFQIFFCKICPGKMAECMEFQDYLQAGVHDSMREGTPAVSSAKAKMRLTKSLRHLGDSRSQWLQTFASASGFGGIEEALIENLIGYTLTEQVQINMTTF